MQPKWKWRNFRKLYPEKAASLLSPTMKSSHAVEATMKAILADIGQPAPPSAIPSKVIELVVAAGILPAKYQQFWNDLSKGIQGVITVRNAAPGAGHGPAPGAPPPDDATGEYAVNMAGSNIVFLLRQWAAKTGKKL
ncbi:MAG TPA: abortive infection family protein [Polyangia bacterium]|nr:abortive infection family protein [Polyangia bacterium]